MVNKQAIRDYTTGIERKIIMLQKLMKEENYTGRSSMKHSNDPNHQDYVNYQYLMEMENTSEKLFNEVHELLGWIKDELAIADSNVECCTNDKE